MSSAQALCKNHEGTAATASCERCGDFVCDECIQSVRQKRLCRDCIDRYELKDLTAFKVNSWGKRDAYVWVLGLFGTVSFGFLFLFTLAGLFSAMPGFTLSSDVNSFRLMTLSLLLFLSFGLALSYFFMRRGARQALFFGPFLLTTMLVILAIDSHTSPKMLPFMIVFAFLIPIGIVLGAYRSGLNKLAFQISLTDEELQATYHNYVSNKLAYWALLISLLGVLLPMFSFVSLTQGLIALNRSHSRARPRAKRQAVAATAIAFSMLGLLQCVGVMMIFMF